MKEIYDWVPWFQELAGKIEEGGETYLIEKARQVEWGEDPPLLRYGDEGIDPFSFFYFLASKNTKNQRQPVYDSVSDVFDIESSLPDTDNGVYYIFPTPQSNAHLLFHERENFTPDLLWRLFREAVQDNPKIGIGSDDFKNALELKYTRVPKLTQTLFLINPEYFLPVDNLIEVLSKALGLGLQVPSKIENEIKDGGYEKYLSILKKIKKAFPECQPYEINMFLDRQKSKEISVSDNFFHISTNVYDDGIDYWDDFKENNRVYTGGSGGATKNNWEPKQKDGKIARLIAYATPLIEKAQYTRRQIIAMASKELGDIAENTIETQLSRATTDSKLNRWGKILKTDKETKIISWKETYLLTEPNPGDIILVRTGIQKGRAIGIVYRNGYAEDGVYKNDKFNEDAYIHVLWINKLERDFPKPRQTRRHGFEKTESGSKTFLAFKKTEDYKPSFDLINSLTENSIQNGGPEPDIDDPPPETDTMKHPHPLNQILYGPPGTGKTWNTVNHAVAIIEGKPLDELEEEDRKEVKQRFDKLKEEGQIEMGTFHQNFTYEDFIEGIRPVLDDDDENIKYKLSEGVFRKVADRANKNRIQSEQTGDMDELLQAFAESIEERLELGEEINLSPPDARSGATIRKVNRSEDGNFKSVLLGGSVTSPHLLNAGVIKQKYDAFHKGEIAKPEDIKGKTGNRQGLATYYFPLFQKIKQFHDEKWQSKESVPIKKQHYVLIIDEINRGNIAKIFGELITLIEPSKRIGSKEDETTVTLPYSKEEFGVPDNLYIIGTMNTADRSIALLDTALRRRFEFIEMMPDSKLVSDNIDGVNCQKLLATMNNRICFLLDREHQIGHTYLLGVNDLESLAATFKNKIIPLLQEYFYDNWEKIDLVLNCNGFIDPQPSIDSNLFKNSDLIDEERKIYELSDDDGKWEDPESYQAIYKEQGETDESEQET